MRDPEEIWHNGERLSDALGAHAAWLLGDGGRRLDWRDASLDGALLSGALLSGALLDGASLNGAWLNGASLDGAWLNGASLNDASLNRASLNRASLNRASLDGAWLNGAWLNGASLNGASLDGAWLNGASGNMGEVKSAQFDRWSIAWVRSQKGGTILQIGCQRHSLDLWRKSDPRWIAAMDRNATDWWEKYRDVVLALVDASPATPYGKVDK